MTSMPKVSLRDCITVGESRGVRAVVSHIYDAVSVHGGNIQVVYCQDQPIDRDVRWNGTHWEFVEDLGGHANGLQKYIKVLQSCSSKGGKGNRTNRKAPQGKKKRVMILHRKTRR